MSFELVLDAKLSKQEQYARLLEQVQALVAGETDGIANAANFAALVFHSLTDVNWAGFYFYDGEELVVGPYQGLPACVRIAMDQGVCGVAAARKQTQMVADVNAFDGHIACDPASRSELVVPIVQGGSLIGVFDVDSPKRQRFDQQDRVGMETLVAAYQASLNQS